MNLLFDELPTFSEPGLGCILERVKVCHEVRSSKITSVVEFVVVKMLVMIVIADGMT